MLILMRVSTTKSIEHHTQFTDEKLYDLSIWYIIRHTHWNGFRRELFLSWFRRVSWRQAKLEVAMPKNEARNDR